MGIGTKSDHAHSPSQIACSQLQGGHSLLLKMRAVVRGSLNGNYWLQFLQRPVPIMPYDKSESKQRTDRFQPPTLQSLALFIIPFISSVRLSFILFRALCIQGQCSLNLLANITRTWLPQRAPHGHHPPISITLPPTHQPTNPPLSPSLLTDFLCPPTHPPNPNTTIPRSISQVSGTRPARFDRYSLLAQ